VKERCDTAFSLLSRGGVYYAFLFQSQPLILGFFLFPTYRRCGMFLISAVSMEAHYREFSPTRNT
ncbi:hypothetical protein, partial [Cronobacter sakazakii]|uniref:hypothetical protein n=1 Tax=Cronobacter sakazakii TaxID=28141 RepID=UPI001C6129FF